MGLSRREGKIRHPLHTQLIPNGGQVFALVELNLVGYDAGTQLLVGGILQIPARLRLLDEFAHNRRLFSSLNCAPHLKVLRSIAVLVLARPLPGDHIGSERGEAQLEDVLSDDGRDDVAGGGVDNDNPTRKKTVR